MFLAEQRTLLGRKCCKSEPGNVGFGLGLALWYKGFASTISCVQ